MLLDIHSHILPCVDDGAKNLEESIVLLEMLKSQGVTDVVATPHFYPHIQSAEEFLQSRQEAYNKLKDAIKDKDLPKVHIGCEMFYYDDMGKIGDIKSFTIENSPYILVELSMTDVTKRVVETIENMCDTGYIPIMAPSTLMFANSNASIAFLSASLIVNLSLTTRITPSLLGATISASDTTLTGGVSTII